MFQKIQYKIFEFSINNLDKILHFIVGLFIAMFFSALRLDWPFVFGIVFLISMCKEVYDSIFTTGFNLLDFISTLLGCGVLLMYNYLITN